MQPRSKAAPVTLLCAVIAATPPALAIRFGEPDGDRHPNVGTFVLVAGDRYFSLCTGTLIAPDVFLTAAHCADILERNAIPALVTLDPAVHPTNAPSMIAGTPFIHPGYDRFATLPDTSDIAVVVLEEPFAGVEPARLPEEGLLEALATRRGVQDITFTLVGYGNQAFTPPEPQDFDVRYVARSFLLNLRNAWTDGFNLMTSNNPGEHLAGGTCFGDSGGPVFLGTSNTVVSVTSFGITRFCNGNDFSYRLDIPSARAFPDDFVEVP
jgi:secreted trypsin-like serine protease